MLLDYDDFYHRLWNEYISHTDVSLTYRKENSEFIKTVTFSLWRKYKSKNVSELVYAENLKIFFYNLFLFQPESFDVGVEEDFNRE